MILKNITLYLENEILPNAWIKIEDSKIIEIGSGTIEGIDLLGMNVLPGFIDQHIHGANQYDFMDPTPEAIHQICSYLVKEGVTSVLATTMTQTPENIKNALRNIASYQKTQGFNETQIIGVHLEGPFINVRNKGAQNDRYIIPGTIELFKEFQDASNQLIKLVTYAPELDQDYSLTKYLLSHQIMPSIGHSGATFSQCEQVKDLGVKNLTHFYNGMSQHSHREPGVVTAGLYFDEYLCEMIVDGIHIHPDVVKTTFKIKGKDGIILITDAIRAKGLADGVYELGGQSVNVSNNKATLDSGTLAGSVLNMNDAIKNMMKFGNASLHDIMYMTSINPAKQLNVFDTIGSIEVGKDADLVVIDSNQNVVMTIIKGQIVYKNEEV